MDAAEEKRLHAYNYLAYLIIVLQGFGLLLPWNVMLNATSYFQDESESEYRASVPFYITAAYIYPQLPLLFVMVYYGQRLSFGVRIISMLTLQVVCMALLPVLAPTSLWTTLSVTFLIGLSTAILQGSLFGLTSQGLMAGQGIAGITASVSEVIVKATVTGSPKAAAVTYFLFSSACLIACIITYIYLMRMPFTQYHVRVASFTASTTPAGGKRGDLELSAESGQFAAAADSGDSSHDSLLSGSGEGAAPPSTTAAVFSHLWVQALSVFLVFLGSFMVFPGVAPFGISFKGSLGAISLSSDWWQTVLLLVFNVFDTAGRSLPALFVPFQGYGLLAAACGRFVFVPLFLACAKSWAAAFSDVAAFLVMAAFAFTNGYFASLGMMAGPGRVKAHDRERGGFLMSFCLQAGILVGSQIAFAFTGGPTV